MGIFISIIALVLIFILWRHTKKLKDSISVFESRIQRLERIFDSAFQEEPVIPRDKGVKKEEVHPEPIDTTPPIEPLPVEEPEYNNAVPQLASHSTVKVQTEPSYLQEIWQRVEQQFIENWTGIVGAIIMVMGVGFLGIYAALKMQPFFRFLMITAFAIVLLAIFIFLRKREKWKDLATWLRSSSGAILLFACLGAGGIPGLKWITDPHTALGILLAGIAFNLYCGFAGGTQMFASLHVILSLAALGIAPQSHITLIISGSIVLCGILLTYRSRWEYHLLITISGFLIYHLFWYFGLGLDGNDPIPFLLKITGISAIAATGIMTGCVHYRTIYKSTDFEPLPFTVHLLNWIYMATGFLLYSTGSKWNTVILTVASLIAFLLARRARRIGIRWLYITDSLIAQSIALFALSTLSRWGMDSLMITALCYLEIFIFLFMMIQEQETILRKIGVYLHHFSGIVLMLVALTYLNYQDISTIIRGSCILGIALVLETAFHVYTVKRYPGIIDFFLLNQKKDHTYHGSFGGIAIGLITLTLFGHLFEFIWSPVVFALVSCLLLVIRQRVQSHGLGIGMFLLLFLAHGIAWLHISRQEFSHEWKLILYAVPFLIVSIVAARRSFIEEIQRHLNWPGIYLFITHLSICGFIIFNPISPFIPGIFWLVLSLACFETAHILRIKNGDSLDNQGAPDRFILHGAYTLMALFLARHVLVHMQSPLALGMVKIRLIIELFALAVMLFWAMTRQPEISKPFKGWRVLHPLMWELFLLFSIFVIALEVPSPWHPASWVAAAFILLWIGETLTERLSRFRFYSLVLYWMAAFHIAFIATSDVTPSVQWLDQAWIGGCIALVLQLGQLIYYYHRSRLDTVDFPPAVSFFKGFSHLIYKRQNIWIYYPFFLAVALFLYWSFDRSVLTLLLVAEAFAIFVLSVILKENHFRYISMGALLCCLIRLIFFDLSQSATITRALVFLGVGIIMIVMNTLYNKYKDRF